MHAKLAPTGKHACPLTHAGEGPQRQLAVPLAKSSSHALERVESQAPLQWPQCSRLVSDTH
jgi:hypothetical protein